MGETVKKRVSKWFNGDPVDNSPEALAHGVAADMLDVERAIRTVNCRIDSVATTDSGARSGVVSVAAIGTAVTIGPENDPIDAVIQAVSLRGADGAVVQYECVWWSGKERKAEWVGEEEIIRRGTPIREKMKVGFIGSEN